MPLTVSLAYSIYPMQDASENENMMQSRIDWAEAERSGAVLVFSDDIGDKLELYSASYMMILVK